MRITACLLLSFLMSMSAVAQNQAWKVVSSAVTFKVKNAGLTVDGSFSGLEADIVFDGDKPAGNKIEATVDVKSVQTGIDARNNHLKKEEYFNAGAYPRMKLAAVLFSKQAAGRYMGYFSLTIKNTTRAVSVPFGFTELNGAGTFTGSFTINRRDYGVGGSSWILADNVEVLIILHVSKK